VSHRAAFHCSGLCPRLAFIDAQPPEMLAPERRMELAERVAKM
jgi:hypothetical protein